MASVPQAVNQNTSELFELLFTQDRSRILGYILTLVPHRPDAEDILQRVSITLWNKFDEFDQDRDFFSWSCGIAYFTVCNFRRKVNRDRLQFSQDLVEMMARERTAHLKTQSRRFEFLQECIKKLSPDDQELVLRASSEEATINDFAVQVGNAAQTLYNRLGGLRRSLARCVKQKLTVEGLK